MAKPPKSDIDLMVSRLARRKRWKGMPSDEIKSRVVEIIVELCNVMPAHGAVLDVLDEDDEMLERRQYL